MSRVNWLVFSNVSSPICILPFVWSHTTPFLCIWCLQSNIIFSPVPGVRKSLFASFSSKYRLPSASPVRSSLFSSVSSQKEIIIKLFSFFFSFFLLFFFSFFLLHCLNSYICFYPLSRARYLVNNHFCPVRRVKYISLFLQCLMSCTYPVFSIVSKPGIPFFPVSRVKYPLFSVSHGKCPFLPLSQVKHVMFECLNIIRSQVSQVSPFSPLESLVSNIAFLQCLGSGIQCS